MEKRGLLYILNKKSQVSIRQMLIHLAMAGLLVFVFILMLKYVKSIENDTEFQNIFLSKDIALLMNTLYSAPGNVEYTYSSGKFDLTKFSLEITDYGTDKKPTIRIGAGNIPKNYPYGKNYADQEKHAITGANTFKFSKADKKVKINKNE